MFLDKLTVLGRQSHFRDEVLRIRRVCPQYGTAVIKGWVTEQLPNKIGNVIIKTYFSVVLLRGTIVIRTKYCW